MEKLVEDRPQNVHAYIVNYMQENYADQLEDVMVTYEDDDEEEDDDDMIAELPDSQLTAPPAGRRRRSAVSAESMDPANMKNKKKTVIEKSDDDKKKILARLQKCFLFAALDGDALDDLVLAVAEKNFTSGEFLMKQGDDGDYFYIVEE